jgi:hypothetical protein
VTIFDLLFLILLLATVVALIGVAVSAVRGRGQHALRTLRKIAFCAAIYIGTVYVVTAFSKPVVHQVGDSQCSDDWCIAVEGVNRTPTATGTKYEVTLRIFSRARRRAQRENIATDVYLVDSNWNRYDPILDGSELPLNTLLQPLQSVTTRRHFELPADSHEVGLKVGHRAGVPVCLIIGECEAFRKGDIIRLDEVAR